MKKQLGILLFALMIAIGVTGAASAFTTPEKPYCKPVIVPACKPVCIEICKPTEPNNGFDPAKHPIKKHKHAIDPKRHVFDPVKKCDPVKPKCDPAKKSEDRKCDAVKPKCDPVKPKCEPVCKPPVCNGETPPVNT